MVDNLADLMVLKEVGSLLFKRHLKCYYRQMSVDPVDILTLGNQFNTQLFLCNTVSGNDKFLLHCTKNLFCYDLSNAKKRLLLCKLPSITLEDLKPWIKHQAFEYLHWLLNKDLSNAWLNKIQPA